MNAWQKLGRLDEAGFATETHPALVACAGHALDEITVLLRGLTEDGDAEMAGALGRCLLELVEAPWDEVNETAKDWWVATVLEVARRVGEAELRDRLIAASVAAAEPGDAANETASYGLLIRSRGELVNGNPFLATVTARDVAANSSASLEMKATALEIVALAARKADNPDAAVEALAAWWTLYEEVPGGAVQQAGRYMMQDAGRASPRGEEMLRAASWLETQWEAGNPDGARAVLASFIAANLTDWRDPAQPELGTIRERARRLAARAAGAAGGKDRDRSLVVIKAQRLYHEITGDTWEATLSEVKAAPPDARRLILLSDERINANEFAIGSIEPPVAEAFVAKAAEVAEESQWAELGLEFWAGKERDTGPGTGRAWVGVEHGGHEPELAGLIFAVRPALIAGALQLSVYAGLVVEPCETLPGPELLERLNHGELERLPGFTTLRNAVVKILVETGHRLESEGCGRGPGAVQSIS